MASTAHLDTLISDAEDRLEEVEEQKEDVEDELEDLREEYQEERMERDRELDDYRGRCTLIEGLLPEEEDADLPWDVEKLTERADEVEDLTLDIDPDAWETPEFPLEEDDLQRLIEVADAHIALKSDENETRTAAFEAAQLQHQSAIAEFEDQKQDLESRMEAIEEAYPDKSQKFRDEKKRPHRRELSKLEAEHDEDEEQLLEDVTKAKNQLNSVRQELREARGMANQLGFWLDGEAYPVSEDDAQKTLEEAEEHVEDLEEVADEEQKAFEKEETALQDELNDLREEESDLESKVETWEEELEAIQEAEDEDEAEE